MTALPTAIDPRSPDFAANAQAMREQVAEIRAHAERAAVGGGEVARKRHLSRGKLLPRARVYLALGAIGFAAVLALAKKPGDISPAPAFAHGARAEIPNLGGRPGRAWLFGSYHVSQQNTQTGRLTEAMFDEVLAAALVAARAR